MCTLAILIDCHLCLYDVRTVALKPVHEKIARNYSRYFAECTSVNCHTGQYPGHDVRVHPHRVKLYQIGCVGSDLVLVQVRGSVAFFCLECNSLHFFSPCSG